MESDWFKTQRRTVQEIIYESVIWSIQSNSILEASITISRETKYFSVKEATRYLDETFFIIVENSENDGNFLDAIFRCFPKFGNLISYHKEQGWLEYDLGGGSSIRQVINTKLASLTSNIFTKNKSDYLRYFVIIDSDRKFPEMELSQDTQTTIAVSYTHLTLPTKRIV